FKPRPSQRSTLFPYTTLFRSSMYIGRVDKDENQILTSHYKPHVYLYNTHGVILNGFFHRYYFRMPGRRRRELRERLKKGQSFIRSEEHTSELQSRENLVCRLL